jgi:hypothetical protein
MSWERYRFALQCPNALILATLYGQPLPDLGLFKGLLPCLRDFRNAFNITDLLWVALEVPTTAELVSNVLSVSNPFLQSVPASLIDRILARTRARDVTRSAVLEVEPPQTKEQLVVELGWVLQPGRPEDRVETADGPAETTISPRFAKTNEPRGHLKHLRNPDQPTPISAQIDNIPRTEAEIHQLAAKLRMSQKAQGRTKVKAAPAPDDPGSEMRPMDVLGELGRAGYLEEEEARKILAKFAMTAPRPQHERRAKSAERNPPKKPGGQRYGNRGRD